MKKLVSKEKEDKYEQYNLDWLKKLHREEVRILDELDRVCKKNDLKYFFTGGTLIGAVKYKKFIPWDDDIDVGMLRKDFEKFLKIAKTELKDEFYLDSYKHIKKGFRLYVKLKLKNTMFVESAVKDLNSVDHGIFIDIFPYDNIEEFNSEDHLARDNFRHYITKLVNRKSGMKNFLSEYKKKHKIIMFFVDVFLKICPTRVLLSLAKRKISSNKNDNSKYISNMTGGLSLEKETHLRSEVFPLVKLEFEGKKYYCPKEYDKLLRKIYGDYEKDPPEDKRVTHKPYKIVFSDGEVIDFEKES